ncbi:YkgJ family cysteine cluster protein [Archaeoglobus sp.]
MQRDFGLKLNCIINGKFCGKCCYNTEMPLTEEDIARIEKLGFKREDFTIKVNGIYRLRNVNGKCFFLDEDNRCKIYDYRPLGCRIYPAVLDENCRVVVDDLCPKKHEIRKEDLKKVKPILKRLVREIYGKIC